MSLNEVFQRIGDAMDTKTYTLEHARRELARRECAHHGHDWDVLQGFGCAPHMILCARSGESHAIQVPE
jgi:hypothetical protein